MDKILNGHRDFLLFVPHGTPSLRAILTYYSATGTVNQEGDVHVNDTLQGMGKLLFCPFMPYLPQRFCRKFLHRPHVSNGSKNTTFLSTTNTNTSFEMTRGQKKRMKTTFR